MSRTMTPEDYWVEGCDRDGHLHVVGRFSSAGKDWPPTMTHAGRTYRFASIEAMESHMIGRTHGHARFVPDEPNTTGTRRD